MSNVERILLGRCVGRLQSLCTGLGMIFWVVTSSPRLSHSILDQRIVLILSIVPLSLILIGVVVAVFCADAFWYGGSFA